MRVLTFLMVLTFGFEAFGQEIKYRDDVYVDYINGIEFYREGAPLTIPSYDLNGRSRLHLQFDDLRNEESYFTYEIIHCDRNWQPSELEDYEYMASFNSEEIEDYDYSVGPRSDYVHYELFIPNEDVEPILSGNYILIIYDETEEKVPVLTRRFMVSEPLILVEWEVKRSIDKFYSHHDIEMILNTKNLYVSSPLDELSITVLPNMNWGLAESINPSFISGDKAYVRRPNSVSFPALKEFRNFNIRSLKYAGWGVHSLDLYDEGTDVILDLDRSRGNIEISNVNDTDGNFVIGRADDDFVGKINTSLLDDGLATEYFQRLSTERDKDLHAEYANVVFTLESKKLEGEVYVMGKFSDWKASPKNRLDYDEQYGAYTTSVLLKQGYYEYIYVFENEEGILEYDAIEGSWFGTENEYTALVYFSEYGAKYDRLVGISIINSVR